MRRPHLVWARNRQWSEVIDLQPLFDEFWNSDERSSTLSSQSLSPTNPLAFNSEAQRTLLSLERITSIVGLWNYNSPQVPLFVSMQAPIPAS
jgi:hypothetical protein